MIWPSRIFFSLVAVQGIGFLAAGAVNGRVEIVSSRDPDVRKHLDYSGVVVWLEPLSTPVPALAQSRRVEMVQKDKHFTPHILAIATGTTVDFPNYDPIFHNAFSNYNGQIFDVGLYAPQSRRSILFRREGVVRVFCNIHPAMSAVIVVLKSPYFSISSKSGGYALPNMPPGSYRLHVFHERATEQTLDALSRPIDVPSGALELPPIKVSESGYLVLPHTNKYGKDYPPSTGAYMGAKP